MSEQNIQPTSEQPTTETKKEQTTNEQVKVESPYEKEQRELKARKRREAQQKFVFAAVILLVVYAILSWLFELSLSLLAGVQYTGGFWHGLWVLPAYLVVGTAIGAAGLGLLWLVRVIRSNDDSEHQVRCTTVLGLLGATLSLVIISWIFPSILQITWSAAIFHGLLINGVLHTINTFITGKSIV